MSSEKVTTLSQLQTAAARSLQASGEVAQAAADAIEEALDTLKQNKPQATAIIIPITGWNYSARLTCYKYYYDIDIEGITANDRAEVTVAPESVEAAVACGLCPTNETLDGVLRLRANSIPAEEIEAEYWIENGKE